MGMKPEDGGMETCRKIQMSASLLANDCEGCTEKPFCGFRANTAIEKYQNIQQRVRHIGWLLDVVEVTGGIRDLLAWELSSMILLRKATAKAESEYRKMLDRERENKVATK